MKNRSLGQSFKTAFRGFYDALVSERNMKIHAAVAVLVILAGVILRIDAIRWVVVWASIGLVFICELLNTAIEKLTDMVTKEFSEKARAVKDISAAAVLTSAVLSAIAGIIIFYGPVVAFFNKLL